MEEKFNEGLLMKVQFLGSSDIFSQDGRGGKNSEQY